MTETNRPPLSDDERARYARHLTLPQVGPSGQDRLRSASILLVGAGGLGSSAAQYLAAAGIGRLGIVDFDRVEPSNLQRQVLYGTADVGRPKAEVAALHLRSRNPHVRVEPAVERIDAANAVRWVEGFDVVLDGSDNLPTRYALSDACVVTRRPYVHGSVYRFEGHAAVFSPPDGPCYRCPFPSPPGPGEAPDCAEGGVLGVLPGLVGTIQATEAIKIVLGLGPTLRGRLLVVDALSMSFREFALRRRADCAACGDGVDLRAPIGATATACSAPGGVDEREWTPSETADRIRRGEDVCLLDVRTDLEWQIVRLEDAVHIPMDRIAARLDELDRDRRTVVLCHHGSRSALVADFLRRQGFRSVLNLAGGIDAWARTVDRSLPRY